MSKKRLTLFLRIFLWIFIGIAFLFTFIIGFFLFLPETYILRQIEIQSRAAGWPIYCQNFHYRPLGSFAFQGIEVAFQPDFLSLPIPFLQIDRVQIRARIWPMLFRRISVASIEIENPRLSFTSDLSQKVSTVSPQKPSQKAKPFLFSFSLDTLVLENFTLRTEFSSGNGLQALEWRGLSLRVSHFFLSEKAAPTDLNGKISLFTTNSHLHLDSKWGRKEFTPHLALDIFSQKQGKWEMALETMLFSPNGKKRIFGLRCNAHGEKAFGQGILDSIECFLGTQRALWASGRFSWTSSMLDCEIQSFPVALASVKPLLSEIFPDSLFKAVRVGGKIRLCSGKIIRGKNQLGFDLHGQWKDVLFEGFSPIQFQGFEGSIEVVRDSLQGQVYVTGQALFPSIMLKRLPRIKNTKLLWALDLENGLSSHSGEISGIMEDVWEGKGQIHAFWKTRAFAQTKNLTGQAALDFSGIELGTLFLGSPKISGKVYGHADLQIQEGRKGKCDIFFSLPKLIFSSGENQDSLPPLDVRALFHCIAKENFEKWVVEESSFWIGKGFSGNVKGEISPQKRFWHFALSKGILDNAFLGTYLPFSFLDSCEGIKASGQEALEIDIRATPKGMNIQGSFSIENTGVVLPLQKVQMQEIQGKMEFSGNEKQITGRGKFVFGNALFSQIRPDPFLKNQWEFAWAWTFPDQLEILHTRIAFPSVALQGELEGKVAHFSPFPILHARMGVRFSSQDSIFITPSFSLSGDFETQAEIRTKDLEKGHLQIYGRVVLDSLYGNILPFLEIQNVFGKIPFSFSVDPVHKKWISPIRARKYLLRTYSFQKAWLTNFSPALSTLTIEKIKWQNYTLDHLEVDTDFSEGAFDIPRFRLELLGGNGSGSISVGMYEGDPLWSIQADLGQINSATLVRGLKTGEETELNATLYFQGKGINPQTDFHVDGALHITQIGPAFTSTLLEAIDPKGRDRNIRLTRRLLSMGSKPKRFSFEIRHGYVYPSLELDDPWYSPLPIPEKIQYGRLPLAFFLRSPVFREP